MTEHSVRRVPMPVAAAALVLLLANANLTGEMLMSGSSKVAGLVAGVLVLALAYGLWRGSGRARFWTTVFSTGSVVHGIATFTEVDEFWLLQMIGALIIVGLLLVPASSRRWFQAAM